MVERVGAKPFTGPQRARIRNAARNEQLVGIACPVDGFGLAIEVRRIRSSSAAGGRRQQGHGVPYRGDEVLEIAVHCPVCGAWADRIAFDEELGEQR